MNIIDLTDWATTNGLMGDFTVLRRAYSVGLNTAGYQVITGYGEIGTVRRAFVLVYGVNPQPVGACVNTSGSVRTCTPRQTQSQCNPNGTSINWYQGQDCSGYGPCGQAWADSNYDNAVDQDDFAAFQVCYTNAVDPNMTTKCKCLDRDKANGVDDGDFTKFQACITGPMTPFTLIPAYPGNCVGTTQLP
jgi:hypothetical protein